MTGGAWSGVITAVLLVVFIAGVAWAWSGRRRSDFEQAARVPLEGAADEGEEGNRR